MIPFDKVFALAMMTFFKKFRTLALLIILTFLCACLYPGDDNDVSTHPRTWIDTDWSGGKYESASDVETDASQGELLLAQDVSAPLEIFTAQDPEGVQRAFYDLEVFNGKLYLAAATKPGQVDGGDIFSYDYGSDSFQFEYAVLEQGIVQMRAHKGKLYVPGLDSITPGWLLGNFYIYDGSQWIRKETVPEALHVFDVGFYRDKIFVTTRTYDPAEGKYYGKLYQTDDEGDTWQEVFRVEPLPGDYRSLHSMGTYQGKLFIQSDNRPAEGDVIFTYDGDTIEAIPLAPQRERSYGALLEFNSKLYYMSKGYLHIYNGDDWNYVILPFAGDQKAKALTVYKGCLYGAADDGILYRSPEGVVWKKVTMLSGDILEIQSLETYHGRLYIGTSGVEARLFVSASAESGELISKVHDFHDTIEKGTIAWDAIIQPGTSVLFQLRSSKYHELVDLKPFIGPDGTPDSFYNTSGENLDNSHKGDRFIQYRVLLQTEDPALSPVLEEVRIQINL